MASNPSVLWQAKQKAVFAQAGAQGAIHHIKDYMEGGGIKFEQTTDGDVPGLYLVADLLPVEIPLCVGAAVHMLRSSLDTAVSCPRRTISSH